MKYHILVDGCLLQTNKTWYQMKERQNVCIGELLRNEYMILAKDVQRPLRKDEYSVILSRVHDLIKKCAIWLPFNELRLYSLSKIARYRKAFQMIKIETR